MASENANCETEKPFSVADECGDNGTEPMGVKVLQQHRRNTSGLKKGWQPGQSGNPSGRKKGFDALAALRAFVREKPDGEDKSRYLNLLDVCYKRAMAGSSRHLQLFLDRLMPLKSIKISEDTKRLVVEYSLAAPPLGWTPPTVVIDADGEGKLLTQGKGDVSQCQANTAVP